MARKILLADDSVTAQNMGRRILTDAGYHVTTVNNGSAALKRISESKPDLIVLDVYMPGYGGLEVCQRLRESPETARIPVLLTVGKLEPFKADDARRVRADAFIVKPFEASELLTALTKLEDKIVPQAQPGKPGRFAKAWAATDEYASGKDFGNSETGWKNRLSIPPPHTKHREPEAELPPGDANPTPQHAAAPDEPKPMELKSGLEEALLSSLPQDVTPEEIAAIKAAAAAFSAPREESTLHISPVFETAAEPKLEAPPAESFAGGADRESAATLASVSAKEPAPEPETQEISATANLETTAEQGVAPETTEALADVPNEFVEPPAVVVQDSAAPQDVSTQADDEVTAALASLAPMKFGADAPTFDRDATKWDIARDQGSVTMAAAVASQEFTGPRWIAEAVTVLEDEATIALEQEMERAFAGFAAADAARMSFAAPLSEPSVVAEEQPSAIPEPDPDSSEPASFVAPAEPAEASSQISAQTSEPAPAQSSLDTAAVENSAAEALEVSSFAAAASASSSPSETSVEPVSQLAAHSSDSPAPAADSAATHGESDLAAAWENWKQIRESVVGSELGAQIADQIAELQSGDAEATSDSQPESASASAEDGAEIADIVDTVLADLKPKLMEEIAKKMGKKSKRKK